MCIKIHKIKSLSKSDDILLVIYITKRFLNLFKINNKKQLKILKMSSIEGKTIVMSVFESINGILIYFWCYIIDLVFLWNFNHSMSLKEFLTYSLKWGEGPGKLLPGLEWVQIARIPSKYNKDRSYLYSLANIIFQQEALLSWPNSYEPFLKKW